MSEAYSLILKRRTVRLFKQKEIKETIIKKLVNSARLAPSARNFQFLEYLVVRDKSLRDKIFPHTKWGGYVYPKRVPPDDKKPAVYIFILVNKDRAPIVDLRDVGAAAQNILISLVSFGLGGCWIESLDRKALSEALNIPYRYEIDSVIAAGYPAESPKLEESEDVKYWLDAKDRLHVPKRPLKNILYWERI